MKSRRFTLVPLAAVVLSSTFLNAAEPEYHIWTDKSGRKVEATMLDVDTATAAVKIKTKDGREFAVPIANLSPEDVTYAKAKWAEMKAGASAAAPATTPPAAPTTPAAPGSTPPPAPAAPKAAPAKPAPPRPVVTVLPAAKFKAPTSAEYLRSVKKVRPRLLQTAEGWAYLKNMAATDPVMGKMLENIKASGEKLLETPELTRVYGEQRSTVTPGSKAIYRIAQLGLLHFVDGDPRWKDRGIKELDSLCSFPDWYPDDAEVTADFVIATSLAWDWFRDGLNSQQAQKIKQFISDKGVDVLVAHLDGEPAPATARGQQPGTSDTKSKAKAAPKKKVEDDKEPDVGEMAVASAAIIAGLAFVDEDAAMAKTAVDAAAKVFGRGMMRFAPAGIWPESMEQGDVVMDYAVMVLQSLRSAVGNDFGFSMLEGIPQSGTARMHMVSSTGQLFNYGDASSATLSRKWVSSWLAGMHGNPGNPAVTAGAVQGPDTAFLGLAGYFIYNNPHAAGDGTADTMDYVVPGGKVAALRSAWNDRNAMYVAVKGGDNSEPSAQLDVGSFVLDAGGQRWAVELGAETDRAPGFKPAADRTKRYELYREGTAGQNTLYMGSNQALDGKAFISSELSTPERGFAIVDMSDAFAEAKDAMRGVMMVRGAQPYVLIQDEYKLKGNSMVSWNMHTRAEAMVNGNTATLTQAKQTLTLKVLSPEGATFVAEDAPEQKEPLGSLKGVKVLKVNLPVAKGEARITILATQAPEVPVVPVVPLAEWAPKK
ncbi:MAG: heparinase II/III family protein [Verrucomicrobiales bacterium]|nr:heparinase II/III family protein [Verrucomicrobiales bacterium]MCP5556292.1 heparinase II/III family protein [Verrucomicrobiaceae bacterium]